MSTNRQIIEAMQALVNALRHEEEVCVEVEKAEKILHEICKECEGGPLRDIDRGGGDGP